MKQSCLKKAISLLLVLTMLIPLASPAFAAVAAEEQENMPYQQGEEPLGDTKEVIEAAELFGGGYGGWTLEKLGGSAISSIVGYGVNQAFGAIFGSDTDTILKAIDGLSKQLDGVNNRIKELQKDLENEKLNDELNDYREFIGDYHELYALLNLKSKSAANDPALTREFLRRVHDGNDATYKIKGDGVLSLIARLKNRLLVVKEIAGKNCNIFGAFDLLERQKNRWEHQGYTDRKNFRGAAIGIFTQLTTLYKLSCIAKMDDCKARGDTFGYWDTSIDLEKLEEDIKEVETMAKRMVVREYPDLRCFRNFETGYMNPYWAEVRVAQVTDPAGKTKEFKMSAEYIKSMFPNTYNKLPGGPNKTGLFDNFYTTQPEKEIFKLFYDSYGKSKSLYQILFNSKEGNFINVGNLEEETGFATNTYRLITLGGIMWFTDIVDNSGKSSSVNLVNGSSYKKDKYFSVERYCGPLYPEVLKAPNPVPEVETMDLISGMEGPYELPYNGSVILSVEPVEGSTYQWLVDKSGSGMEFEDIAEAADPAYTLPALEASMNGWMYSCAIMNEPPETDEPDELGLRAYYTLAAPVTLILTGVSIPTPVTEHEVGSTEVLKEALEKVADGSWDAHTLILTDDIFYPYPITMTGGCDVTIDLNGYTLTVQPDSNAEPNLNPMSNNADIAAIYVHFGSLSLTGDGALSVVAGDGVAYGVYAGENGSFGDLDNPDYDPNHNHWVTVASTGSGTGVYTTDGGRAAFYGDILAEGDNAYAIECFDGGNLHVDGTIAANGNSSCGVYMGSNNTSLTYVGGFSYIEVSGENSRGAYVSGQGAQLSLVGGITATGDGAAGLMAGGGIPGDDTTRCRAYLGGGITASSDAVIAYDGALVQIMGNVIVTEDGAAAVSATGAVMELHGDLLSNGSSGTGISASAWDLTGPAVGAVITAEGNITADTPLRIEGLPVEESEHAEETTKQGYYTLTDGTSTVWVKPGSLISMDTNAKTPSIIAHPQDKTVEPGDAITLTVQAYAGDGGTLSYQWYSNTTDDHAGGTPIPGATDTSYTPPTDMLGTEYYYVIVTNTNEAAPGKKTAQVISCLAAVTTTYTVTFDKNGGDTEASPAARGVSQDGSIDTLPTAPTKAGYTFIGWNTQPDGSGTAFTAATAVTGSITVYAQWTAKTGAPIGIYTIIIEEDAAFTPGETNEGILIMTVKDGVSGLRYFGINVTPFKEHPGEEVAVFVHQRNNIQVGINATKADFDVVNKAKAGFNVESGDVIKTYIVDDLTNAIDSNPNILQQ
jgi:uncharacterized repeat protein (TIGR02543 family)